uniref:Uncharacterized protein n=1 Tax=Aegilops tauschii TaxID=37682 RepID=M8AWT7_AEGTA
MEDRDLAFLLDRSPVLEILTIILSQVPVRLRLVSHSVRCVQLCYSIVAEVLVVDAPRLESLLQSWGLRLGSKSRRCCRVKVGHAPKLRVIGYLEPGEHDLEIGNTAIKAGTKLSTSTSTLVPSVKILALELKFQVRSDLKKVPNFLRCFPNVETLHIQSEKACEEPTGKVGLKFWLEGGPITCIRQQLKKLIFREFRGSTNEVAFLKFIAEKARVLEKMVVVVYLSSEVDVSAMLKPLTCAKWANGACKLQVYKSIYSDGSRPVYGVRLASENYAQTLMPLPFYMKKICHFARYLPEPMLAPASIYISEEQTADTSVGLKDSDAGFVNAIKEIRASEKVIIEDLHLIRPPLSSPAIAVTLAGTAFAIASSRILNALHAGSILITSSLGPV